MESVIPIQALEMDIAFGCNLRCDGCTHYSNYPQKGLVPFATGREWIAAWSARVTPEKFTLLGGEPSLNPDLIPYIELAAEIWPEAVRRVVSNGLVLDRRHGLWEALARTGTGLEISVHSRDPVYRDRFMPKAVAIDEAHQEWGFDLHFRDSILFLRTYRGTGRDMLPFEDGNPRASWVFCTSRFCVSLHQGRLWKCPPIAHLGRVAAMFDLVRHPQWQPYLAYRGYGLEASDAELTAFLAREEEPICGMCPATMALREKPVFPTPNAPDEAEPPEGR